MAARVYRSNADFAFTCPQTEVKASLGLTCGQYVESPSRCWFSVPGHGCISVVTQIPHDAGLAPVHPTVDRIRDLYLSAPRRGTKNVNTTEYFH